MKANTLENYTVEVEEDAIGMGGEHRVYQTTDGLHVIKVAAPVTGQWQTQGEDFMLASDKALEREHVRRLPSAILINPTIIRKRSPETLIKGKAKDIPMTPDEAQMFPRLDGYEELTLRWPQLKDPFIQEQIIQLGKQAERIFKKDKFGMDPLGFAALTDNIEGAIKNILQLIHNRIPATQESVRALINLGLDGVPGQMRNVLVAEDDKFIEGDAAKPYTGSTDRIQILEKGKIYLADTGVHDLRQPHPLNIIQSVRDEGIVNVLRRIPAQQLTFPLHYIMWGAVIELLLRANPSLRDRHDLPFIHDHSITGQIKRNVARQVSGLLADMMIPQFERYEELNK